MVGGFCEEVLRSTDEQRWLGDHGNIHTPSTQAMSEDQLKAFWEAVQADAGLQQKLQGVTEPDVIAAIAQEAGFNISAEEIKRAHSEYFAEEIKRELTDEQLDGVIGGANADACFDWA